MSISPDGLRATPEAPKLAVIIPHYNDLKRLETCLGALVPQLVDTVEVVVADNDSPVDLAPLAARFTAVRFVNEPTKGAAAARNRGVRETTAPYLAFLDSDCVPAADWLATALDLCGRNDLAGGRVDTFDETPAPRSGAEAFETVFAFHQRSYIEKKGFSVTANLLTSRAVFDATGDMIVGLSEDMDWCQRAIAKGYGLVYADTLQVSHPTRQDWAALSKKWHRTTLEGFHLNGTSPVQRLKWALRAVAVLGSGLVHLPQVLGSDKLASGQERISGALTLLRLRAARCGWMLRQALVGA